MKRLIFVFLVLNTLLCALVGCEDSVGLYYSIDRTPPSNEWQVTVTEGIWGNVWFWEGDFQPDPVKGTITPVERQIYVFEPTSYDSVVRHGDGGFYSEVHSPLIAISSSNRTGFYEFELPPGRYSVFVKEDSLFYMEGSNSIGIGGFEVFPDSIYKLQLKIAYLAVY